MFEEIAREFAELNLQIIKDIRGRGYSHADDSTLSNVRENLLVLKEIGVKITKTKVEEKT